MLLVNKGVKNFQSNFNDNFELGYVNIKDYNAKGDGVSDDSLAFILAIAKADGRSLYVPPGTYKLSTWATLAINNIKIIGTNYLNTKIIGPSVGGIHFISVNSGGGVILENISFERFDKPVYTSNLIEYLIVKSCRFYQNRNFGVHVADSTNVYGSGCKRVLLEGNFVELSPGFAIESSYDTAIATNNHFKNVRRDLTVWQASSTQIMTSIKFGSMDNRPYQYYQSTQRRAVAVGNTIDGMYNYVPAGSFNTTNGIQISASSAVVTGNVVTDMTAEDGGNCEAIYCKAQDYIVSNNVIQDGSPKSACIAIKGGSSLLTNTGKNNLVINNVIRSLNSRVECGIILFGQSDVIVKGNIIDNVDSYGIQIFGSISRVHVLDNEIKQCGAKHAIALNANDIDDCIIEGNIVEESRMTTGTLAPIRITTTKGKIRDLTIVDGGSGYTSQPDVYVNGVKDPIGVATIKNESLVGLDFSTFAGPYDTPPTITLVGGGGSGAVISFNLSDGHLKNMSVSNNKVTCKPVSTLDAFYGISFQIGGDIASSVSGLVLRDNDIVVKGTTSEVVTYQEGINFNISNTNSLIKDCLVDGIRFFTPFNPSQTPRLVAINSNLKLSAIWKLYENFEVRDCQINGRRWKAMCKALCSDSRATMTLTFSPTQNGSVGSTRIATLPGNILVTNAMAFVGNSVLTSPTNTASFSISLFSSSDSTKQVIPTTLISSLSANSYIQGTPNGLANNAMKFTSNTEGTYVYLNINNESINGGEIIVILDIETTGY